MPQNFAVFLLFAVLAEAVGTIVGFGASTILIPLAAFVLPVKEAVVLVSVFHLFGASARTLMFFQGADWRVALGFGVPAVVFSYLGASLFVAVPTPIITKILGALLILYALYSLFRKRLVFPASLPVLAAGGSFVGFLAGLVGTAGALRGAFLSSWNIKKEVYLGTAAVMGLGADITRVLVYGNSGLIDLSFKTLIALLAVAVLGTFLGRKVVLSVKQDIFGKIIFIALLGAGIRFLV